VAKFRTSLSIFGLASAASEAFGVRVNGETEPRIKIDAGGRITWGDGSAVGDVWLSRTGAETLTVNKSLVVSGGVVTLTQAGSPIAALPDGGLSVDTTSGKLFFRSGASWIGTPSTSGDSVDIAINSPLDTQFVQYDEGSGSLVNGIRITYGPIAPVDPQVGDIWLDTSS
jgi:hypothetical protein